MFAENKDGKEHRCNRYRCLAHMVCLLCNATILSGVWYIDTNLLLMASYVIILHLNVRNPEDRPDASCSHDC